MKNRWTKDERKIFAGAVLESFAFVLRREERQSVGFARKPVATRDLAAQASRMAHELMAEVKGGAA